MAKTVFTKEDRKSLKLIAEEVPKIRLLMDELLETFDVMSSKKELQTIKESLEQVRRGETRDWDEYLDELRKKGAI